VDKENIVHFSQHQPLHDNYTMLNTPNDIRDQTEASQLSISDNKFVNKNNKKKTTTDNLLQVSMNKRCDEAKKNLETLLSFERVQFSDNEGKTKIMTEIEKTEQVRLNEKQVDVYCQ
jgi:hypothetical protein